MILVGAACASLAVGIAIGLVITWVLWPVQFTGAEPADLRQSYKDDYIRMISSAYQMDGDLTAARQRLSQLGLGNPTQTINRLITRQTTSTNTAELDALTSLSQSLSVAGQTAALPASPGAGSTPQTIVVVTTPTEPIPVFALAQHTQLSCADQPETARLIFIVRDAAGRELPNVGIQIHWNGGDDTVYTGLKPERGIGYADWDAAPGNYSVTILNAQSDTVSDLVIGAAPANCATDRGATPRGWKLVFQEK